MSSQGTGSADTDALTFSIILDSWGNWARSDSLGGSMRKGAIQEVEMLGGLGWLFTDNELCIIDRAIAGLLPEHKRVIKHVHLHRRELSNRGELVTYRSALVGFADALHVLEGSGHLEVLFIAHGGR